MSVRFTLAAFAAAGALSAAAQVRDISPPQGFVRNVAAHSVERGRLLALTASGVQWTADGGRTWTQGAAEPDGADNIFVHPGAPGVVFASYALFLTRPLAGLGIYDGGDLFRSADFGMTWMRLRAADWIRGQAPIYPFAARPGDPSHLYATIRTLGGCVLSFCNQRYRRVDATVVESLDGGFTWSPAATGLPPVTGTFGSVDSDPVFPIYGASGPTPASRELLILVQPEAVHVSFDAGRSWRRNANPALEGFEWVKPDPLRGRIYYALRGAKILRSDDGGETWKEILDVGREAPDYVPQLLVESGNSDRIWIGVAQKGVLFSGDRGETWRNFGFEAERYFGNPSISFQSYVNSIAISPAAPLTAYVTWKGRLYEITAPGDGTLPVTEFLDVANGRYWLTANSGEALAIDYANDLAVARRTGASFRVWSRTYFDGMAPVCRFQGDPRRGLHSRFITLQGAECAAVERSGSWVLEGRGEFAAFLPIGPNECRGDLLPLRRFFNGLADANHRYVVDEAVAADMAARGWIGEGIAMCVAPP